MIKGDGFEVEVSDGHTRIWVPVEFFASTLAQDSTGRVGLVLLTFAVVDGELRQVGGRVRKLGLATPRHVPHE